MLQQNWENEYVMMMMMMLMMFCYCCWCCIIYLFEKETAEGQWWILTCCAIKQHQQYKYSMMNINGMLKHTKLKTHSFAKVELQQRLFEATKICNVALQVISCCGNSISLKAFTNIQPRIVLFLPPVFGVRTPAWSRYLLMTMSGDTFRYCDFTHTIVTTKAPRCGCRSRC